MKGTGAQDTDEQNTEGNPIEDEGERRNSIGTPVHVDTSEPQSAQQEEVPQAGLDDVVAEGFEVEDPVSAVHRGTGSGAGSRQCFRSSASILIKKIRGHGVSDSWLGNTSKLAEVM